MNNESFIKRIERIIQSFEDVRISAEETMAEITYVTRDWEAQTMLEALKLLEGE